MHCLSACVYRDRSAYDEAARIAGNDAVRAERLKSAGSDAADLRVLEEYVRFMKLALMVCLACTKLNGHCVTIACMTRSVGLQRIMIRVYIFCIDLRYVKRNN